MDHCQSFLKGLKIGAVAAPLMGVVSVIAFMDFNPREVQSEIGPYPALITETMFCFLASMPVGSLAGAIVDYRRDRQTPQLVTIWLLVVVVVPITILLSLLWFLRLVGVRWLYEHGL